MTTPSSTPASTPPPPPGMPPFARRVQPKTAPASESAPQSQPSAAAPTRPSRGPFGITHGWWVIIALIYIISPIDFIPELVLGPLGIVDDAGMLAFAVFSAVRWWQSRRSTSR